MEKHYHGHRRRLKDRFLKDPSSLADYELVELLLFYVIPKVDVKPQAKKILEKAGSLKKVLRTEVADIRGLGAETETYFKAIREFLLRAVYEQVKDEEFIMDKPEKVIEFLGMLIGEDVKENFVVVFLNMNKKVLGHKILFKGTVDRAAVYPREVAENALRHGAVSVMLAHNHPGGNVTPSPEDIEITDKIQAALKPLEISILDHLVVSGEKFYSFRREKLLRKD